MDNVINWLSKEIQSVILRDTEIKELVIDSAALLLFEEKNLIYKLHVNQNVFKVLFETMFPKIFKTLFFGATDVAAVA